MPRIKVISGVRLASCPFCGAKPEIVKDRRYPGNSQGIWGYHVECTNDDCILYRCDNKYFRLMREAVAAWNERCE